MFISLLQAHKECTRDIKWGHLIQSLNSMGTAISHDCAFDYEEDSLCDPRHLLNMVRTSAILLHAANKRCFVGVQKRLMFCYSQVDHNTILLIDIVKKAETMYRENPKPQAFIEALHHTRHTLSNCVHHSDSVEKEPVTTCFNKLEAFLKKKGQLMQVEERTCRRRPQEREEERGG
ncbi:hypothetical protein DPX16_7231 [Anabarilius grahami]|uniref:Uncharacterized protein n=1 Tax=Anabarilius grahami TaxID=495550 RepID=A0A3N0XQE7_ANAGA|nr:hypothetical protein DPX16_7231 [Anabarilius grahami]